MSRLARRLPLLTALLAGWLGVVGSARAEQAPGISPNLPGHIREMMKAATGNYVLPLDDFVGYLRMEVQGNRGSFLHVHLSFQGFYLRPVLTLSKVRQQVLPYLPPAYRQRVLHLQTDIYEIVPQHITVTAAMANRRVCYKLPPPPLIEYFQGSLNQSFRFPPPPTLHSYDKRIPGWIYSNRSRWLGGKLKVYFNVECPEGDGGPARLYPFLHLRIPGGGNYCRGWATAFLSGDRKGEGYLAQSVCNFTWVFPAISLPTFSLEKPAFQAEGSAELSDYPCGADSTLSDTSYVFRYQMGMGRQRKIKTVLRSADGDPEKWVPTPGEVRTYRLTLEEPDHKEVTAVRFILEDTSSHPGIATNAGNHVRSDQCPDCTLGKKPERISCTEQFSGTTLQRSYVPYNACPLDSLPDVFFSSRENPGFDLSEDGISQNLQYTISQKAYLEPVEQDEITVKVTVMDGAASSRLRAEVMVGGLWFPAQAEGPDAESDGLRLMIPVDKDRDGLADRWENFFKTYDPNQDAEDSPGASHPGDGLTAFEEYRGIYTRGRFARPYPTEKDVFVHDYSGQYGDDLNEVYRLFQRYKLTLWQLNGDEFRDEIVNYQESKYKRGDQYAIVVMPLSQCPGVDLGKWTAGLAAQVGPPTRDHHTAVLRDFVGGNFPLAQLLSYHTSEGTLAHELGHLMNLPHHGDKDRMMKVDPSGEEAWVACRGGQHSGRKDCIMRYNCARYFLDMDFIPQSAITRFVLGVRDKLQPFTDYGQDNMICKDAQGDSVCGPATCGACLERINVKSY